MKNISLPIKDLDTVLKDSPQEVAIIGKVTLDDAISLYHNHHYEVLDLSQGTFGYEAEEWCQYLGWSHCGPVYGNSGVRSVDVLQRLLERINAVKVTLPDDVARRHMNTIKKNEHIREVEVGAGCKLYSMKDGNVYNKKGKILMYKQRKS